MGKIPYAEVTAAYTLHVRSAQEPVKRVFPEYKRCYTRGVPSFQYVHKYLCKQQDVFSKGLNSKVVVFFKLLQKDFGLIVNPSRQIMGVVTQGIITNKELTNNTGQSFSETFM